MKKVVLTLSILSAFAAVAVAGSESYSGKEMKQVAPAPAPDACPSWTGFYIGAFGGYKFSTTDIDLHLGGTLWDLFASERDDVERVGSRDLDSDGAEVGGIIGYNYQWNNWVFGLEAAGAYLWVDKSRVTDFFSGPNEYLTDTSLESHYLLNFGPRIGYALCKWLPYLTAGLAVGDFDFDQHVVGFDLGADQGGSEHEANVGWMVGGGLEYALNDHWRVRPQYQYVDLGSAGFEHTVNSPLFAGHSEAELRAHNVSFAIIYGF